MTIAENAPPEEGRSQNLAAERSRPDKATRGASPNDARIVRIVRTVRFIPVYDPKTLRALAAAIEGQERMKYPPLTPEGIERLAEIATRAMYAPKDEMALYRPTVGFFLRYRQRETGADS